MQSEECRINVKNALAVMCDVLIGKICEQICSAVDK